MFIESSCLSSSRFGSLYRRAAVAACSTGVLLAGLTGCGIGPAAAPVNANIQSVQGIVHGGQNPIQGASVTLYVAGTSYGAGATVIGSATTDVNGSFGVSPSATSSNCPSGSQAYITAASGYPSGQSSLANTSTLLMAALGDCKNISANTNVIINEVTTVAAAYALSGFITTTSSGSGSSLLYSANVGGPSPGLAHAFLNAAALANYGNGTANATVSASSGGTTATGSVPLVEINTLANEMAACVNSATASTACTSLFGFTPSISGTAPTNTLQAFVYLARNPYPSAAAMNSSTGLIALGNSTSAPFVPYLSGPPVDWSLSIVYSGGPIANGYWLELDASDTAYVDLATVTSSTPLLFGISAYGNMVPAFANNPGTVTTTRGIAPDALGNIWVTDNSTHIYQYSTSTGALELTHSTSLTPTWPVAVDTHNNMWFGLVAVGGTNLEEVGNTSSTPTTSGAWATSGATLTTEMPGGLYGITVDANQNIWTACYYKSSSAASSTNANTDACLVANNGTTASPNYTVSSTVTPLTATLSSSAYGPYAVSMDASGNAWYSILGGTTAPSATSTTGIMEVEPNTTSKPTSITPQGFLSNNTAGAGTTSGNAIGTIASEESAIDGAGTMFMGDVYGHPQGLHAYSTTNQYVLSPTAGFASCYLATSSTQTCAATGTTPYQYPTYGARGIAIDSTGSVWLDNYYYPTVTQVIGIAAPTNPLLSAGKPGLSPGATAVTALP